MGMAPRILLLAVTPLGERSAWITSRSVLVCYMRLFSEIRRWIDWIIEYAPTSVRIYNGSLIFHRHRWLQILHVLDTSVNYRDQVLGLLEAQAKTARLVISYHVCQIFIISVIFGLRILRWCIVVRWHESCLVLLSAFTNLITGGEASMSGRRYIIGQPAMALTTTTLPTAATVIAIVSWAAR